MDGDNSSVDGVIAGVHLASDLDLDWHVGERNSAFGHGGTFRARLDPANLAHRASHRPSPETRTSAEGAAGAVAGGTESLPHGGNQIGQVVTKVVTKLLSLLHLAFSPIGIV